MKKLLSWLYTFINYSLLPFFFTSYLFSELEFSFPVSISTSQFISVRANDIRILIFLGIFLFFVLLEIFFLYINPKFHDPYIYIYLLSAHVWFSFKYSPILKKLGFYVPCFIVFVYAMQKDKFFKHHP